MAEGGTAEEIIFPEPVGPAWSQDTPRTYRFRDAMILQLYRRIVEGVFASTREMYRYNTIPTFVSTYRQYMDSGLENVTEMFERDFQIHFSTNHLSAVGLNYVFLVKLKRALAGGLFADSIDYLFLAAGCKVPHNGDLEILDKGAPPWGETAVEYVIVAMKIRIGERRGHILMDFGYGIQRPVIVMEDGEDPHTPMFNSVSCVGYKTHSAKKLSKDYILWTFLLDDSSRFRAFFMKHPFLRIDYPEKRQCGNTFQGRIHYKNGFPTTGFYAYVEFFCSNITVFTVDDHGLFKVQKFGCELIYDNDGAIVYDVLRECVRTLGSDAADDLRSLVIICLDTGFTSRFVEVEKMYSDRMKVLWSDSDPSTASSS